MKLFVELQMPDWVYWNRHFPDGVGRSVFSSPQWQTLLESEQPPGSKLMVLRAEQPDGRRLTLPVFVQEGRWGRKEMMMLPVGYPVLPIEEGPLLCECALPAILRQGEALASAQLTWWLPPWCGWRSLASSDRGRCACERSGVSPWCAHLRTEFAEARWNGRREYTSNEIYVIEVQANLEEHLATQVRRQQRQHLRASHRNGIEVVDSPSDALIEQYIALYERVHAERRWTGEPFSRGFFHRAARSLRRGGNLVVMRHDGRVVGGGIMLFDRYAVHLFHALTDRDTPGVYPTAVLYALALERAVERGLHYVNLGGINEGNAGLDRFKRQWGAKIVKAPMVHWRSTRRMLARGVLSLGRSRTVLSTL